MVEITVDFNNNIVTIRHEGALNDMFFKCTRPTEVLRILDELLNILNHGNIVLTKIDEDSRTTVGEW